MNLRKKEEFNSKQNWYAEELKRERKISGWDLDEAKALKERREKRREIFGSTSNPFFVLDLILFSLMLPFVATATTLSLLPVFLLFCFLLPGLILWELATKRFPPTWYFILALLLTIVLQVLDIKRLY